VSNYDMALLPHRRGRFVLFLLVLFALRVWADYDQNFFLPTGLRHLLGDHAPADALRFLFNFPVSLFCWFVWPAPHYAPVKGHFLFWLHDSFSILFELGLTWAWWKGLAHFQSNRILCSVWNAPRRWVLPAIAVSTAFLFEIAGNLQYQRIWRQGSHFEPLSSIFARDSFAGYTWNAPAWAASLALPNFLYWISQKPWAAELSVSLRNPLEYLVLVAGLWYGIGLSLDKRNSRPDGQEMRAVSWKGRVLAMACLLFGGTLGSLAIDSGNHSDREFWFAIGVLLWAVALTLSGAHSLYCDLSNGWGSVSRIFCMTYVVLLTGFGALYVFSGNYELHHYGRWFGDALLLCSFAVFAVSLYWFLRPTARRILR
jgi:hypothetical protein